MSTAESLTTSTSAGQDAVYLAVRYRQGGRQHYSIQLPLAEVLRFLPKPNPDEPFEGNRAVNLPHAMGFADYLFTNENWVSPAVLIRIGNGEIHESGESLPMGAQQSALVNITLPRKIADDLAALKILDGQHRTLGIYEAYKKLQTELADTRRWLALAQEQGNDAAAAQAAEKLARISDVETRFLEECISLDIAIVENGQAHQMFVDIADNAKGISRDFRVVLDQRSVVNRIATHLLEHHALLKGRVFDGQSGRMPAKSSYLYGAKAISDIVRASLKGPGGRVGKQDEHDFSLREEHFTRIVGTFFDDLVLGFDSLGRIDKGTLNPAALREMVGRGDDQVLGSDFSMLYSETMIRAIAGAWYELQNPTPPKAKKGETVTIPKALTRAQIVDYFRDLEPLLKITSSVDNDSVWVEKTDAFIPGTTAPQARQGTINNLSKTLVAWARDGLPS